MDFCRLRAPSASVFIPRISSRRSSSLNLRQLVGFHPCRCQKMFVPGFGEASPEAKAAASLHNFFTFVAIKIVLAQLQSYNREAYEELMEFVSHNSLNDGDQFCRRLMRESPRHKGLGKELQFGTYRVHNQSLNLICLENLFLRTAFYHRLEKILGAHTAPKN